MCFSPFASFAGAGLLSIIGLLSFSYAGKKSSLQMLSTTPWLFALQQLCEGFLWIFGPQTTIGYYSGYLFFYIAVAIWPLWIGLSMFFAEVNRYRKKLMIPFICASVVWLFITTIVIMRYPLMIIIQNNINYQLMTPFVIPEFIIVLYLLLVAAPLFLSNLPYAHLFAYSVIGACAISYWLWYHAFGSVWCFFAAWLSMVILIMLRKVFNE